MKKAWNAEGFDCRLWLLNDRVWRGCVLIDGEPVACAETLVSDGQDRAEKAVEALAAAIARERSRLTVVGTDTPVVDFALVLEPRQGIPAEASRIEKPFPLGWDLEVVPVPLHVARAIFAACDGPGRHGASFRIDLRSPLYAFQRLNPPRDPRHWDPGDRLQLAIALSRLVRPHSASFRYAGRLIGDIYARHEIKPAPIRGLSPDAWTVAPDRDWLDFADLLELREVVDSFFSGRFAEGSRLQQAMWYFEYAARTYNFEVRVPLVSTALETLLSTGSERSTAQFTKRVPQLAARLGLQPVTASQANKMWGLRCKLSHGAPHGGLRRKDFDLYQRMEEVLRATLRQSVIDNAVRGFFNTPDDVDVAFPVPPAAAKTLVCASCGNSVEAP